MRPFAGRPSSLQQFNVTIDAADFLTDSFLLGDSAVHAVEVKRNHGLAAGSQCYRERVEQRQSLLEKLAN